MNIAEQVQAQEPEAAVAEQPVGRMLIAARQAQNLSVTDVANRLKLSVQQIEALEQGAYDRLPGAVFVRGFTRNYARLLKLDPDVIVRAVDAHLPRAAEKNASAGETNIPMPAKSTGRWPLLAGIAAVVFLGAALVDVLWPDTPSSVAVAPNNAAALAPVESQPAPPAPVAATTAPAVDTAAVTPVQSQTAAAVPAVSSAPAAQLATAVTANYQPDAGNSARALRLVFDQQSWVQVRDASGKVVLEALYPPGSSREISARPPLTLIVGNAPGVRLTYGDRAIDLAPHTRVAVARLTLE